MFQRPIEFNFDCAEEQQIENEPSDLRASLNRTRSADCEGGESEKDIEELDSTYQVGSAFGGILTLILGLTLFLLALSGLQDIYELRRSHFVSKIDVFTQERRPPENITFGAFENSLNFAFGISNYDKDWDALNNPYVKFSAH